MTSHKPPIPASFPSERIDARKALEFTRKHEKDPAYAARFLRDLLQFPGNEGIPREDLEFIQKLIAELNRKAEEKSNSLEREESAFRKEIVDYYIPRDLIDAIVANGGIPRESVDTQIGVAFIDIADYTFLAKFLSPKENQVLLNGLYTVFGNVLKRRGGYLNKTEGDSLMFHFGGLIDRRVANLSPEENLVYIATALFYTCVEMQRVCYYFNEASAKVIEGLDDPEEQRTVQDAFDIMRYMRTESILANSFNALFQIRIRIGANVGEVSIGNFGPPGNKRWDVIGVPVIEAKRMESTAPVGGLRISEHFYEILEKNGIIDRYYQEFLQESRALNGYFREITKEELFSFSSVILKDKHNVTFRTYSVQVNPGLPETIVDQIILLFYKGGIGADKIVDLIKYYRGNKHVIRAIEDLFAERRIKLRKGKMVYYLFPEKYRSSLRIMNGDKAKVELYIDRKYRLFDVLRTLGDYQDRLKAPSHALDETIAFQHYEQYMSREFQSLNTLYKRTIKNSIHNTYFFNIIFPLIFTSIKASILEYQAGLPQQMEAMELSGVLAGMETLTPIQAGATFSDDEELEELQRI